MVLNKEVFFNGIRELSIFGGTLSAKQVEGIDPVLDCWNSGPEGLFKPPVYDAMLAYMLATIFHETAQTMSPITEYASNSWCNANYCNRMGNGSQASGDGARYKGRGYVQLTGKNNYTRMTKVLAKAYPAEKPDLVSHPDLALNVKYATAILFYGMSHGSFTSRSLHDYIGGTKVDFWNARRIINGTDRAGKIAGYANDFLPVVKAATKAHGPSHVQEAPAPEPAVTHLSPVTLHFPHDIAEKLQAMQNPDSWVLDQIRSQLTQA